MNKLKRLVASLMGIPVAPPVVPPQVAPPPTESEVIAIINKIPFPHGHLALGSLFALTQAEKKFVMDTAVWLGSYPNQTKRILDDILAKKGSPRSHRGDPIKQPYTIMAPLEQE